MSLLSLNLFGCVYSSIFLRASAFSSCKGLGGWRATVLPRVTTYEQSAGAVDSLADLLERLQEHAQTERAAVRHLMAVAARWHSQHGLTSEARQGSILRHALACKVTWFGDSLQSCTP